MDQFHEPVSHPAISVGLSIQCPLQLLPHFFAFLYSKRKDFWRKPNTQSLCFLTSLLIHSNEALSLHHHCPKLFLTRSPTPVVISGSSSYLASQQLSDTTTFSFWKFFLPLTGCCSSFCYFISLVFPTPWACPRASPIHTVTQHAVGIQGTLI